MRIRVAHETVYRYDRPANGVIQTLRLTPRNHDGQYVVAWRIDVSADCRLDTHEDAFGNITHSFTAEGPFDQLIVRVDGEVDTQDMSGVVGGAIERFPPSLFLRETDLTRTDPAILAFAREVGDRAGESALARMHLMTARLHEEIAFDTAPTRTTTKAAEAFALKRGVCQDYAHIFIACARSGGVAARFVAGHFLRSDGMVNQQAGHAWAEAFVPDLGWVGFDPTNGICPADGHVRVAMGLDYLSAAPVRGTRSGGGAEALTVMVEVDQAGRQMQN